MIVYEKQNAFVMITQHDHAHVSGKLASEFKNDFFIDKAQQDEFIYAAYQHDRGWIDLDSAPFWNDAEHKPYSFRDFPLKPRFVFYKKGIDEIQEVSHYSALLCSLLYTTLFERIKQKDVQEYLNMEYVRQKTLKKLLNMDDEHSLPLQKHLRALLICDELSLFLCMQQPGTPTDQYEWFSQGLNYSIDPTNKSQVRWRTKDTIELTYFPFHSDVEILLPYKEVDKEDIVTNGVLEAYHKTSWKEFKVFYKSMEVSQEDSGSI